MPRKTPVEAPQDLFKPSVKSPQIPGANLRILFSPWQAANFRVR